MPPRIQPHRVQIPTTCQCFRTRPQYLSTDLPELASFFHQPHRNAHRAVKSAGYVNPKSTRLRRGMNEWLHGPGKAFRDPLPSSTNYMSAYDRNGNLLRTKQSRDGSRDQSVARKEVEVDVVPEGKEEETVRQEIEDGLTEAEMKENFEARQAARRRKAQADNYSGLPRERESDMRPFPLNQNFRSQPVLSEDLREVIYQQVIDRGTDVGTISAAFGVEIKRVAAVVRLKTIEKQWVAEGKQLARPYNDAVMAMLPQTTYRPDQATQHEGINDLPVHPKTRQQLFYPVSESRQFTREDAAKAFDEQLLAADKRIPHPELITLEKESLEGLDRPTRWARQMERDEKAKIEREAVAERQAKWEERNQRIVPGRRWDFKFQDFSAERTGKDGRARNAVGARYGMPHEDRKRGLVKIPTSVE